VGLGVAVVVCVLDVFDVFTTDTLEKMAFPVTLVPFDVADMLADCVSFGCCNSRRLVVIEEGAAGANPRRLTAGALQIQSELWPQMAASVKAEQLLMRVRTKGKKRGKDGPPALTFVAENVQTDIAM
jgi:hypothetical protein